MNVFATISGFWKACSARERAAVAAAVTFVAAAALYFLLWQPGMAARESLSETLPRLRAQLEDMRWQRDEVAALRKKVGTATPSGDLAVVLRASAAQAPFAPAVERIESLPGGKARSAFCPAGASRCNEIAFAPTRCSNASCRRASILSCSAGSVACSTSAMLLQLA